MIAFLRGRILDKQPNLLIVDVQGVGYEVHVPLSTYYDVGEAGTDVALRIYTHVREETLQLYGFLTAIEQRLFERLIAIGGIGPKLAVAVLSGIEPGELIGAVQRGDIARLMGIPGVGRKTAERIVLELRDRVVHLAAHAGAGEAVPAAPGERLRDDVLSALQNLGYHRPLAEKAVDSTLSSTDAPSFEQALKAALRELMR
ncbi:MAG: Holliday junction branch migration protein RuvA [Acidobacteria bacterium]|nr:Holliday junction branch migration protein RuvA [Acidobacteriota bacterium]